jgi:hypothetical protein
MFDLHPFLSCACLLLTGTCKWNSHPINFLNVYGPCQNKKTFWQQVESQGLLDLHNLVLAGDLNFTLNSGEIWGVSSIQDPLADFFTTLFNSHGLVDFPPAILSPTWRNGRLGKDHISKRLDRFYISDSLATTSDRIRTWVDFSYLSDHTLIFLQFGLHPKRISYPFKLNVCWLFETTFSDTVTVVWLDPSLQLDPNIQSRFIKKMKALKACIKGWVVNHKAITNQKLQALEHRLYEHHHSASLTDQTGIHLQLYKQLET